MIGSARSHAAFVSVVAGRELVDDAADAAVGAPLLSAVEFDDSPEVLGAVPLLTRGGRLGEGRGSITVASLSLECSRGTRRQ